MISQMYAILVAVSLQTQGWKESADLVTGEQPGNVSGATIAKIIDMLEDDDVLANWGARTYLRKRGTQARRFVPALIAALPRGEPESRASIALALSEIGPPAKDAVPELIECTKDKNGIVRCAAVCALRSIGPEAKAAVPFLVRMLRTEEIGARLRVSDALCRISRDRRTIPLLIEALKENRAYHRVYAALILRDYGKMAEASVPALRAGLADKESSVRIHCAWALWRINKDPLVVSVLKKDFRDVNNLARFDAAKVLWEVEKDPAVLPMLKESLHHNDLTSKLCAVLCVRDIGPSARELKGEVRLLLKDPDENIRRAAEEAIKAIE